MDIEREQSRGGPRRPGLGKIGVVPPQASNLTTTGLIRVIKKTSGLEVIFWFVTLTSVEVSILLLFCCCSILYVCFLLCYTVHTVVNQCHRHVGWYG